MRGEVHTQAARNGRAARMVLNGVGGTLVWAAEQGERGSLFAVKPPSVIGRDVERKAADQADVYSNGWRKGKGRTVEFVVNGTHAGDAFAQHALFLSLRMTPMEHVGKQGGFNVGLNHPFSGTQVVLCAALQSCHVVANQAYAAVVVGKKAVLF